MKRIVVDPITRIEGHLRVEMNVDEGTGKVTDALSSGTAWRGIELVMKNRDPRDAWAFVQRICGVCTSTHALASLRAVEDALKIRIPKNANYIRNIMHSSVDAHDHTVHFYHLHALDFISPVRALEADPAKTAEVANSVLAAYNFSDLRAPSSRDEVEAYPKTFPTASPAFFQALKLKVEKLVKSGQLGIFSAHYWDHPDYNILPPEVHLMAVAHYLNVLDKQRDMVIPHVIFGGKNPHPHYIIGGMPCSISMNDMNAPVNAQRLSAVETSIDASRAIVESYYLPDVLAIGAAFVKAGITDGGGLSKKRVLAYGSYPDEPYQDIVSGDYNEKCVVRCNGVVENFAQGVENATFIPLSGKDFMDSGFIAEEVEHSWYKYPAGKTSLHPSEGITDPNFTGPKVGTKEDWKELDETKKYSWIKSPTMKGKPCEVGPLAKYIVVYTKVKKGILKNPTWAEKMMVDQVDRVSAVLGLPAHVWLCSTVGRTAARALDAQVAVNLQKYFHNKLVANIKSGDTTVAYSENWHPEKWPKDVKGVGILDAPRGALGHWVHIKNSRIENYQCVVPTTWNACPKTVAKEHGAYEESMLDTHLKKPEHPLEVVRSIHSFDPCLACATHLYNKKGELIASANTDVFCLG